MAEYLTPDDVDALLKLPRGKAARLARRGKMPACILPDGTIRFDRQQLQDFLALKCDETRLRADAKGGAR